MTWATWACLWIATASATALAGGYYAHFSLYYTFKPLGIACEVLLAILIVSLGGAGLTALWAAHP